MRIQIYLYFRKHLFLLFLSEPYCPDMKNLLYLLVLLAGFSNLYSQDLIILRNGDEIEGKVLSIESGIVKYKKQSNLEGPSYTLKEADLFLIKYPDGSKDVFVISGSGTGTRVHEEYLNYYREGLDHLFRGRYYAGVDCLSKAINRNPESDSAYYYRAFAGYLVGMLNSSKKDFQKDLEAIDKALIINDKDPNFYAVKSDLLWQNDRNASVSTSGFANGRISMATHNEIIEMLTRAIEKPLTSAKLYFYRGKAYLGKGQTSEALKDTDEAIRLKEDPDFYEQRMAINLDISRNTDSKSFRNEKRRAIGQDYLKIESIDPDRVKRLFRYKSFVKYAN